MAAAQHPLVEVATVVTRPCWRGDSARSRINVLADIPITRVWNVIAIDIDVFIGTSAATPVGALAGHWRTDG